MNMTHELIVKVPDAQLDFFKELLNNLKIPFNAPTKNGRSKTSQKPSLPLTPEQQEFVDGLRASFKEVEAHERGEIQLRDFSDFLDELDQEAEVNMHLSK
jgi:hypothetical protein